MQDASNIQNLQASPLAGFAEFLNEWNQMKNELREIKAQLAANSKPQPKKESYSIKETAEILGYHYNTVYNLIRKRKLLPANRACRNYKIHHSDIEKLRKECTF